MKIFAVYTDVILLKKPTWLEGFLRTYQPRELHVTLKQPCFIEEGKIEIVKSAVRDFFAKKKIGRLSVIFDKVVYNDDQPGAIMVCATQADALIQLQKELCYELSWYNNYVEMARKEYEINFNPHITIGDDIPAEQYKKSLEYLKDGCVCEGEISAAVLAIVDDMSVNASNNPVNKTIYSL